MARPRHSFQITIAPLHQTEAGAGGTTPLTFVHTSHDDILSLIDQVRRSGTLGPDASAPVILGLKLLGQVMLDRKSNPLFESLRGAIGEFTRRLKSSREQAPEARNREGDHSG